MFILGGEKMKDTANRIKIGQRVRNKRKSKGWKQSELAKKAGCSLSAISTLERGVAFSLDLLNDVARALGAPLHELTGEKPQELDEKKYLEKGDLADLIELRNAVKELPALYLGGRQLSKESRMIFEEFLDMIIEREKSKIQKKDPKEEA